MRRLPLTIADWLTAAKQSSHDLCALLDQARRRVLVHAQDPAWIALADDDAWRAQMSRLQQRLDSTPDRAALVARYPLLGVPFAVKDNIDVAGIATTAACPAFAHVPERSATAVLRLIDAGAVWLGKTNLDQFATGLVGTRSPYGRPASTFDDTRVSGGSSSGSAVAVARGWVAFALGTDTAGSGRVPAGFNNLVGLKPTPGRASTAGVLPACRTLDCVSVFALTVADASQVLSVIEGPDADDAYSHFEPGNAALPDAPRIGVPLKPPFGGGTGYEQAWDAAVQRLRDEGATVVPMDFAPLHAVAGLLYHGPWVAERHVVVQPLLESRPEALDPVVASVVGAATKFSATDAFRAQYTLAAWRHELARTWHDLDALMVPTAPHHPTFAEIDADPVGANSLLGTYTNFVNLLGWCALALPAGFTEAGLPFGITLIGPGGADAALAHFGRRWTADPERLLGATGDKACDHVVAGACLRTAAVRPMLPIAVVGAHLSGLPLNGQLTERGATLRETTSTAPLYRLFALPDTTPPKPGMVRVAEGGHSIEVEVWDVPTENVGSFLALIPSPLGLGSLVLADGRSVHGFVCEAWAVDGARDVSDFGGWRRYLAWQAG